MHFAAGTLILIGSRFVGLLVDDSHYSIMVDFRAIAL